MPKRYKEARLMHKAKLTEMATKLGVSQPTLSAWESERKSAPVEAVIKMATLYGVTTDYLLGVSDSRTGIAPDSLSQLDEDEEHSVSTLAKATKYLLDISAASSTESSKKNYIYDYYMLSIYRGALTLAKAGVLPKEMFKIDYTIARDLASAAIAVQDAKFVLIEDRSRTGLDQNFRDNALTTLIEEAEKHIIENYIL